MTDLEYQEMRNRLIPAAENYTNRRVGSQPQGNTAHERFEWVCKWNRVFLKRMDELWQAAVRLGIGEGGV